MTPYERTRRTERRMCRLVAGGCFATVVLALLWPLVALLVGYVVLVGVAVLAASAFKV